MMTRLAHAWELALWGLQRGEIAGLRWPDVDLDGYPKSTMSRRILPLPDRLASERLGPGEALPGVVDAATQIPSGISDAGM